MSERFKAIASATVTIPILAWWILSSGVSPLASGVRTVEVTASDPRRSPAQTYQVGDLLVRLPVQQEFFVSRKAPPIGFDYGDMRRFGGADQVDEIGVVGEQAWAITGTHPHATGYEPTNVSIDLRAVDHAPDLDFWCHRDSGSTPAGHELDLRLATRNDAQFYIYGEDKEQKFQGLRIPKVQVPLLNSPWLFKTDVNQANKICSYRSLIALTSKVILYIRFDCVDLEGVSISSTLTRFRTSLMGWLAATPRLDDLSFHKENNTCNIR